MAEFLSNSLPNAQEIHIVSGKGVFFVDGGQNFGSMSCAICSQQLDHAWWQDQTSSAYETGFLDLGVVCPMCGASVSLNDLDYEWPQGFASWIVDIRSPGVPALAIDQVDEISRLLGHQVRIVVQHI